MKTALSLGISNLVKFLSVPHCELRWVHTNGTVLFPKQRPSPPFTFFLSMHHSSHGNYLWTWRQGSRTNLSWLHFEMFLKYGQRSNDNNCISSMEELREIVNILEYIGREGGCFLNTETYTMIAAFMPTTLSCAKHKRVQSCFLCAKNSELNTPGMQQFHKNFRTFAPLSNTYCIPRPECLFSSYQDQQCSTWLLTEL